MQWVGRCTCYGSSPLEGRFVGDGGSIGRMSWKNMGWEVRRIRQMRGGKIEKNKE